jgi:uncharacterized membrane protein
VLCCKWGFFVPACVVERLGPIASLKRSSALTKGCRMKIFCIILIFSAVFFISVLFIGFTVPQILLLLGDLIFQALFVALMEVVTSVIYFGLREIKEGVSVEDMTVVFD